MKYIYTVNNQEEYNYYSKFIEKYRNIISDYIDYLKENFEVEDFPKYIVLSNFESATSVHSNISLPAYTNEIRMVITPELSVWKNIYLSQIDNYDPSQEVEYIKNHYSNITENYILQLIGHELAHQSELFLDDFDSYFEESIWFEEGMVEYISSKYFFTSVEYKKNEEVDKKLINLYENKYGKKSLEDFNEDTYKNTNDHIFYFYWRSFLTIDKLVEKHGGIKEVFNIYHKWHQEGRKSSLSDWFGIS